MWIGYVRIFTQDQIPGLQYDPPLIKTPLIRKDSGAFSWQVDNCTEIELFLFI